MQDHVKNEENRAKPPAMRWGQCLGALALTLAVSLCTGPAANASGLLIADGGFGGRLLIKEQIVRVRPSLELSNLINLSYNIEVVLT